MKYILFLFTLILLNSCSDNRMTDHEYELKKMGYPKTFSVRDKTYKIYLGSDGHEYYLSRTYHYNNDVHYPGCPLCFKPKKDSL